MLLNLGRASVVASGPALLSSVIPSACADLSAAIGYTSGETWANLLPTPADGQAQTDYDFWLGTDGTADAANPTYSSGKFTLDGGDWFTIKGGNTPLLRNAHKTTGGNPITIILCGKFIGPKANPGIGNGVFGNGGHNPAKHGIAGTNGNYFEANADYFLTTGGSYIASAGLSASFNGGTHCVAYCYDPSTRRVTHYVDSSGLLSTTMSSYTSTTDASDPFQVGACGVGDYPALAGTEIRGIGICNTVITLAEFNAAKALFNARDGSLYS